MNGRALPALVPVLCLLLFSIPSSPHPQVAGLIENPQAAPGNTGVTSANWAGYVASSGKDPSPVVTAVYGSWIVQAVSSSASPTLSTQWVGIGGFFTGDTTLIQVGTGSGSASRNDTYEAWWETLPAASVTISHPVSPGDVMRASVVCVSSCTSATQGWKITISDSTRGWTFTDTLAYSSKLKSAEWIEERPAACPEAGCKLSSLADFNTASYGPGHTRVSGSGSATIGGATLSIGSLPFAEISMVQTSTGQLLAQTSSLTSSGTSFTVQWRGS